MLPFVFLAACTAATAALIEGVVLEQRTGRPLARARVTIRPAPGTAPVGMDRVFADSLGRFQFFPLPSGAYFLTAERAGYAPARYGQKTWRGQGAAIVLETDGRFVADFRLSKLGVVTGQVSDENGVGLPGHSVLVYREGKPPRLAGSGETDDRGIYRVSGLEPGRYHVRTTPRRLEDGTGLLPTYFGHSTSVEESWSVEARLDQETDEINITPIVGRLFRLSGKVTWPGVSVVTLYSDLGKKTAPVDAAGGFAFDQLSPGPYEILAESGGDKSPQAAYSKFWLSEDVEGMILAPAPAPVVFPSCERKDRKATDRRKIFLFARRTGPPDEAAPLQLKCMEKVSLSPGKWEVRVLTPPETCVASVQVDGRPAMNGFTLAPGDRVELEVLLSSQPATIRGEVAGPGGQPAVGATVFLNALSPEFRVHAHQTGTTKAGENGEYVFQDLPPGRYQVLSSFDYEKPEDVDWTLPQVKTVRLEEGEDSVLNLELVGSQ